MTGLRRAAVRALAVLVLAAASGACALQTAGAPTGELTLYATFSDAQHLVVGHAVRVSDVQVGTVVGIDLTDASDDAGGYAARITMSIVDGRDIPRGTTASLGQTSLLGENYVQLRFPAEFDPDDGPFLADDDEIVETSVEPQLEDVTQQAIDVLGAVQAGDLTTILDAASEGLGGRGELLAEVVDQLARVGEVYGDQRVDLGRAIDGLATLGSELATTDVGGLIDDLAGATGVLAEQRTRIVDSVDRLTDLAQALNDIVLEPHTDRLRVVLAQLDPIVTTLALQRDTIVSLTDNLEILATRGPKAVDDNGAIILYIWLSGIITPDGDEIPFPLLQGDAAVESLLAPEGSRP